MVKKIGKCVHCLKDNVELTSDHMFPKAWYPDATPKDLEKWQIPSCLECNQHYGKLENDLLGRVALTLDANNPASAGLAEKALRAINPAMARSDGDAAAREARAKKILRDMFKGEPIAKANVVPGLGERWGRPVEQQLAIKIPDESLPAMTRKMVRGIAYREDHAFIAPPRKIDFFLAEEEGAKEVKDMLDQYGEVYKRDPGLEIRRAKLDGGDVYEITFWQQFKTYATVSKPEALVEA
jgi:hypothetical protein